MTSRRTITLATLLILLAGAAIAVAAISENTGVAYGGTSSLTGPDGVCKKVTNNSPTGKQVYVPASTAAEWQSFVANPPAGVTLAACVTCGGSYTISSSQVNLNLYTYAGSPSCTGGSFTFTISSGVTIGSNSTSLPALTTGSWPSGTMLTLVNNGKIYGHGGAGGAGADAAFPMPSGSPGKVGGAALSISHPVSLDNTNGSIFGGGGGGAGGWGTSWSGSPTAGGGGGGGGQGYGTASGGSPGWTNTELFACETGASGSPGIVTSRGSGGAGSSCAMGMHGGNGDAGGGWGAPGENQYSLNNVGAAGGSAILKNGNEIIWLGGNNSAQVKGAVQ